MKKIYRSKDGTSLFHFEFVPTGELIDVFCHFHPALDGRDPDPHKTHIFASGRLCFAEGHAPCTQQRAEDLARQWAEYLLEYKRTGRAQS